MPVTALKGGAAREAELLSTVLDVLRETGYDRLTIDAVVARARASKQTVYRRWPSKADLVVAAFVNALDPAPGVPDTGSLRQDLLLLLDDLLRELAELGDVIVNLLGELRRNPNLATAMEQRFLAARRRLALEVFQRAATRGELASDTDIDLLWQVIPATLFFRTLVSREHVDRELTRRLVDHIVMPLTRPAS